MQNNFFWGRTILLSDKLLSEIVADFKFLSQVESIVLGGSTNHHEDEL